MAKVSKKGGRVFLYTETVMGHTNCMRVVVPDMFTEARDVRPTLACHGLS